jgi:hypothetical protein
MGIFKNLINKVLDAEVPPVVEQLARKNLPKKGTREKTQGQTYGLDTDLADLDTELEKMAQDNKNFH